MLPGHLKTTGAFVAPFVYGAAVLVLGIAMKLPELVRLLNVLRRRKS